jgi:hypothetical protein
MSVLDPPHGPNQITTRVETEVDTAGHPFGQVACPIGGRHLGSVDQLESSDLDCPMLGDLSFFLDEYLLQGIDAEIDLREWRNVPFG